MKLEPETPREFTIALSVVVAIFILAGYAASAVLFTINVSYWPIEAQTALAIYIVIMISFYALSIIQIYRK